jgi:hypothetical protein
MIIRNLLLSFFLFYSSSVYAQLVNCDIESSKEICGLANWMSNTSFEIFLNDRPPCNEVSGGIWCNFDEIGVAFYNGNSYYYMNHLHQKISFDTISLNFLDLYTCGESKPVVECFGNDCVDINGNNIDIEAIELSVIYSNESGLHPFDCSTVDYWGTETSSYAVCDSCLNCINTQTLDFHPLQNGLGNNAHVYSINSNSEDILLGGELMFINNENDRDNILTGYKPNEYYNITNLDIKFSEIRSIVTKGDTTYIGGAFSIPERPDILNIAMIVDGTLFPLKDGIPSNFGNTIIYDMELVGDDLYVAGFFKSHEDDPNKSYIMKWDGQDWSSLGGGVSSVVYALENSPDGLYVGGAFSSLNTNIDPINQKSIGLWNGTSWEALLDLSNSGPNNFITRDLEYRNDKIYMAGENTWLNGNPYIRHCLATYKNGIYTPVGPQIGNTNDAIYDIEWHNGELYIGGDFVNAGGNQEADYFAKLAEGEWVGTNLFSEEVNTIHSTGVKLYIGGAFKNLNGIEENDGIIRYGCESETTTNSIEITEQNTDVSFYPNPTLDIVQFSSIIDKIRIYDSFGMLLKIVNKTDRVSMVEFVSGIYFIETFNNENRRIDKILKIN